MAEKVEMSNNQATANDWDAVKPALYEAAKGHWFELDSLFNERDALLAERDRLREALEGLRQRHGCFCELPPNVGSPDHTVECDHASAALTGKGAGEGNG